MRRDLLTKAYDWGAVRACVRANPGASDRGRYARANEAAAASIRLLAYGSAEHFLGLPVSAQVF